MRYCGVDVSARPDRRQLCTLHERQGADGLELVATFYEPGTVDQVARTVLGFGRDAIVAVDAPSGHRLDLLAPGAPLRERLRLADGRHERARVRRPALPPPAAALSGARRGRAADRVAEVDRRGHRPVRRARPARGVPPAGSLWRVIVLPVARLLDRYDALPPPRREPLVR